MHRFQGQHFLVVEDDADNARSLEALLHTVGASAAIAGTLAGALALCGQARFAAIIADIGLPDSHDETGVARLVEAGQAPVIVLTGTADEKVGTRALALGASDYLVKGCDPVALLKSLAYALEVAARWRVLSELKKEVVALKDYRANQAKGALESIIDRFDELLRRAEQL
jgi:DNA-binding response OmpR family regulator